MRNPTGSVLLAALLLACTNGSGVRGQQDRDLGDFQALDVEGPFVVQVEVGPATHISLSGDDNVVPKVSSELRGSTLHVELPGRVVTKLPLTLTITTPTLDDLELGGACTAVVTGLTGERLAVDLSGASEATLSGAVTELDVEVSGASRVAAVGLDATQAEVDASGASTVELTAHDEVDAEASGASTIRIHGDPPQVAQDTSGASRVELAR